ncbi:MULTISPECIES: CPBP family intramembrane glutamic endopeptidase [unclassified Cellulophaga]|uniref:CPBP family intramembrane glutamic endopeptidase n=1 Tax=unclassified Cellulophaga TaxID=2634405 RepID=UPI0026E1F3DA|nr:MULTISPECIES: CPBP family intramembrane glutamic endopeptidase [unclassified Cellulophaga]MDO6491701.1 CPBP family intramembrane metalloprotease [Cellulophaga sp. 2_MG-2023]MDO6495644.1 CPBP family intramembrane metalloprotease [Cellulophaga sp. 3_MG-2023]
MTKKQFWNQLILFITALLLILSIREYLSYLFIQKKIESYAIHTLLNICANLILIAVSYFFIQKNKLGELAGLQKRKVNKWYLLLFPLIYLVLLNILIIDVVDIQTLLPNVLLFLTYCISIGFAEELSIRGFLQSHLINYLGNTRKNSIISVFTAALFFGVIHLLNFDTGIYGELAQLIYATFIGVMFGFLLVITKRLYPLIIVHTIIDFVADLDVVGMPIKEKISELMSLETAALITVLALPCFIYGIFLMIKYKLVKTTASNA